MWGALQKKGRNVGYLGIGPGDFYSIGFGAKLFCFPDSIDINLCRKKKIEVIRPLDHDFRGLGSLKTLIFPWICSKSLCNLTREYQGIQGFQTSKSSKIMIKWSNRSGFSSPESFMPILLGNINSLAAVSFRRKMTRTTQKYPLLLLSFWRLPHIHNVIMFFGLAP